MPEREQGLDPLPVVMPIADEDALLIADMAVQPGINLGVLRLRRIVGPAARKRLRQPPPGLDIAIKDIGNRIARLLPGIPRLQHGARLPQPRHFHRPAGLQDHHGIGIGRQHRRHQLVLPPRQADVGQIPALGVPLAGPPDKQHRPVRRRRNPHRLGNIAVAQGPPDPQPHPGKHQIFGRLVAELDAHRMRAPRLQHDLAHHLVTALLKERRALLPAIPGIGDQPPVQINLGITRRGHPDPVHPRHLRHKHPGDPDREVGRVHLAATQRRDPERHEVGHRLGMQNRPLQRLATKEFNLELPQQHRLKAVIGAARRKAQPRLAHRSHQPIPRTDAVMRVQLR